MTATSYIVGVVALVIGWFSRQLWDDFVDWLQDATGAAGSALWDLCAIVGIVAVCVGVAFVVT